MKTLCRQYFICHLLLEIINLLPKTILSELFSNKSDCRNWLAELSSMTWYRFAYSKLQEITWLLYIMMLIWRRRILSWYEMVLAIFFARLWYISDKMKVYILFVFPSCCLLCMNTMWVNLLSAYVRQRRWLSKTFFFIGKILM